MGYEPLVSQNPLRVLHMGRDTHQMGLVMARAGLGKTAILVQIALDTILQGKRVMHVSIGESIEKTRSWYDDLLQAVLQQHSVDKPHELIDMINQHRMIMTFQDADTFSRPRLEERLNDLVLQNIFSPDCLIVDGLDFETTDRAMLEDLKDLVESMSMQAWFSAISHRQDDRVSPTGVPAPCHEIDDLFETAILLKPEPDSTIHLDIIRNTNGSAENGSGLCLDPTTMMVKKGCC